jgi:hypothetical protein
VTMVGTGQAREDTIVRQDPLARNLIAVS